MRFAVLADVHANWPALEAVLEDLQQQPGIHYTYCLGDLVGYYPYPAECLEALMSLEAFDSIRGNHDRYLIGRIKHRVKPTTMQVIEYTRERISPAQYAWVEGLHDKRKVREHFLLVHGSPRNMDEYLNEREKYERSLGKMASDYPDYWLCFFGHTHKPLVVAEGLLYRDFRRGGEVQLEQGRTYLVNPGSVGQPRDGSPLASYLIYDSAEQKVEVRRVDYPYEETQRAVLAAGFRRKLADRLARGK